MQEVVSRVQADGEYFVVPATTNNSYTARTRMDELPANCVPVLNRSLLRILFFGAGSAAQTVRATMIGYSRDRGKWTPYMLSVTGNGSLGPITGVAADIPDETQRWVDSWPSLSGYVRQCQAGGLAGSVLLETLGCEWVEIQCQRVTAASCGALVARL